MKIMKVSQCKKNFDFKPAAMWLSSLPAYAWGDELICGFDLNPECNAVDLKAEGNRIELAFASIHRNLSLAELARLYIKNIFKDDQFAVLLEKNSLRFSESLTDLFVKLADSPIEFQNWTAEKKLGAKELFVLKAVGHMHEIRTLLLNISSQNPSRQIGIQILENAVELFLMGHDQDELLSADDDWAARLEKLRNPMISAKTTLRQSELANLPWPKFITARVTQHEASLVNEVRLQFKNLSELKRNIEALKKIESVIENQSLAESSL